MIYDAAYALSIYAIQAVVLLTGVHVMKKAKTEFGYAAWILITLVTSGGLAPLLLATVWPWVARR